MAEARWAAVDRYIEGMLVPSDPALDAALKSAADHDLPAHNVSASQGKFLHLLAKIRGARRILEIGTFCGYSTIWLARALPPDGSLITMEWKPLHAGIAKDNICRAGLSDRVEVRTGAALDVLPLLASENPAPFDFIFIDADKFNNPEYFTWALRFSASGSVIVIDNVIRDGAVIDGDNENPNIQGIRRLNVMMRDEPRVSVTALQTVGSKGYDGFALALVL